MDEGADVLVEVWRGAILESVHRGHAAIWQAETGLVAAWGDPETMILPRSSAKPIQALPLIESGAAEVFGLSDAHLALACASHQGAAVHRAMVTDWLTDLGLGEPALRCGPQWPSDEAEGHALIRIGAAADQRHNNCSGKHSGFLTVSRHLQGGAEYLELGHPVQRAVRAAFEDVTDAESPGYAIDGCSAPNFATSVTGLARAMAVFAAADGRDARGRAMVRLRDAMMAHPHLVAGEGGSCTRLMRAMGRGAAVKTGAEAVYVAIVPDRRIGVALKITDGATRASEAVIAQLLVGLGLLDAANPVAESYVHGPLRNRRGIAAAHLRVAPSVRDWRP